MSEAAARRASGLVVLLLHVAAVAALLRMGPLRHLEIPAIPLSVSLLPSIDKRAIAPEPPAPVPHASAKLLVAPVVPAIEPEAIVLASAPRPEHAAAADPALATSAPSPPPALEAPVIAPVFDADYLENPAPAYPPLSRRLGEQGRVLLRVWVSEQGRAERVALARSSGFDRLDQSAMQAVARWRFVPARQGERAVAAHVLVPVAFVLKG